MLPRRIATATHITTHAPFPRTLQRIRGRAHQRRSASATSKTRAAGGLLGLGVCAHATTPSARAEAPSREARRRRPPTFGPSLPTLTARGAATRGASDASAPEDIAERADCPLCKKFGAGPCGSVFRRWLACTDLHPGKNSGGEPRHLSECSDFAEKLAECLEVHTDYYATSDSDTPDSDHERQHQETGQTEGASQEAWTDFVKDTADGIAAGTYALLPYPESLTPKVEVRLASRTGAAFFVPDKDGDSIVAAYLLDDKGVVIAAGSKGDMDMGSHGCVLQFKVAAGMKSTTSYAIYDTENGEVLIFSRQTLLPVDKGT